MSPAAAKVLEARRASKLTQSECAARIGVSRRVWQMWEHELRNPTPGNLLMIATFVTAAPAEKKKRKKA